jgi:hypothetical protein
VSFPGEDKRYRFNNYFSTIALRKMILNIADGNINNYAQLAKILSQDQWRVSFSPTKDKK